VSEVLREVIINTCGTGIQTIQVDDFPAEERDLRVAGHLAGKEVDIISMQGYTRVIRKESQDGFASLLKALKARYDDLQMQNQTLADEVARLDTSAASVRGYVTSALGCASGGKQITTEDAVGFLNFQTNMIKSLNAERTAIVAQHVAIDAMLVQTLGQIEDLVRYGMYKVDSTLSALLSALPTALQQNQNFTDKFVKTLMVQVHLPSSVTVSSSVPISMKLSYLSAPASWEPSYDVYIDGDALGTSRTLGVHGMKDVHSGEDSKSSTSMRQYKIGIDYFASVLQRTGADWVDVHMRLSTSTPSKYGVPRGSKPHSQTVYYQREIMARSGAYRSAPMMKMAEPEVTAMADVGMMENDFEDLTGAMLVSGSSGGDLSAAYEFDISYPVTIKSTPCNDNAGRPPKSRDLHNSRGNPTRILIKKFSVDADLFTYVVPSHGNAAYLQARGTWPSEHPPLLRSHDAKLYLQGAYTGQTYIDMTLPSNDIRLDFGIDKNVQVTTTKNVPTKDKKEVDKSGWFVVDKKRFRIQHEDFLISIRSTHAQGTPPVLVIVSENLPRASETDIAVELISPTKQELIGSQTMGCNVWVCI
jgi:hypothetical protein